MDYSSLTREELLQLLQKESNNQQQNEDKKVCKFLPLRQDQPPCPEEPATPYGFCKKHRNTVQARKSEKEWEKQQNIENPPPPQPITEQAPAPVIEPEKSPETPPPRRVENKKSLKVQIPEHDDSDSEPEEKIVLKPAKKSTTTQIHKNQWGRFEHSETHIVFDPIERAAYGVQDHNTGKILPLTKSYIDICKNKKWKYQVPTHSEHTKEHKKEHKNGHTNGHKKSVESEPRKNSEHKSKKSVSRNKSDSDEEESPKNIKSKKKVQKYTKNFESSSEEESEQEEKNSEEEESEHSEEEESEQGSEEESN
jgi:hypothetical protein